MLETAFVRKEEKLGNGLNKRDWLQINYWEIKLFTYKYNNLFRLPKL